MSDVNDQSPWAHADRMFAELSADIGRTRADLAQLRIEIERLRQHKCPCQTVIGGQRHYSDLPGPVQTPTWQPGVAPKSVTTPAGLFGIEHTTRATPHAHAGTDAPECTTCGGQ